MKTQEYTLSITFNVDEGVELPAEFLDNVSDPDALASALSSLAEYDEFAEALLRVNGIVYGPETAYL